MEIIQINGYTQEEKLAIARQYLAPRQTTENGLQKRQFTLKDDAIELIIDGYTRESGVRQLEREIGAVARGVAKRVATGERKSATVKGTDIKEYLGARKFFSEIAQRTKVPGVATGLAWTPVGGDILFIEASVSRGNGRMLLTGQLGEVMKESAQAALSFVKANAESFGIPDAAFKYWDLHVHVPAGAVPKDGPSAGVTMLSALVSIYTQRCVKSTVAMTGEITLRGLVLPVGGIKEKVLAAKRAGIKKVVLPQQNQKDIEEIDRVALRGLQVVYVSEMKEVLEAVLAARPISDPRKVFKVTERERRRDPLDSIHLPEVVN
jgi:ATP-dependent Lon protease